MKRLLIVDDNDGFASILGWKLEASFRVVRCRSIGDALCVILSGRRFDVILCRTHCGGPLGGKVFWKRLHDRCEEQASKVVLYNSSEPTGVSS